MSNIPHSHVLVLPRLHIQNANAISSPLTHGFPSMTAFLGFMWALERKTRALGLNIEFNGIGVVCHHHQEQVHDGGFVKTFRLTRNPLKSNGDTAAIIEEGRIHLEVSLLLAVYCEAWTDMHKQQLDITTIQQLVSTMRIAGGSVIPASYPHLKRYQPWLIDQTGNEDQKADAFHKVRTKLLPGTALVLRDDALQKRLGELKTLNSEANALDAWLSVASINWHSQQDDQGKVQWLHDKPKGSGWIVPIPVGYGSISDLHKSGTVANTRDNQTPFCFVESLYSLGEWVSPHRIQSLHELLWHGESDKNSGLYRCRNYYQPVLTPTN